MYKQGGKSILAMEFSDIYIPFLLRVVVLYEYKQGKRMVERTCCPSFNNKKCIFIQDDVINVFPVL